MADNTQQTVDSGGQAGGSISQGTRLPYFKPGRGKRPSPLCSEDLNKLVKAMNAFLQLKVARISGNNPDGSAITSSGFISIAEEYATLTLFDGAESSGGNSSVTPLTVVSEQDNYLTCVNSMSVTTYVAKPWWFQRVNYVGTFSMLDGTHTFSYSSAQVRLDAFSSPVAGVSTLIAKEQIEWPTYEVGEVLECVQPVGGTGLTDPSSNPITYQDSNQSGRIWKDNGIIVQEFPISLSDIAAHTYSYGVPGITFDARNASQPNYGNIGGLSAPESPCILMTDGSSGTLTSAGLIRIACGDLGGKGPAWFQQVGICVNIGGVPTPKNIMVLCTAPF